MIKNPYRKNSSIAFVFDELMSMPVGTFVEWEGVYSVDGSVIPHSTVRSYLARMKIEGLFDAITRIDKHSGKMKIMRLS